METTDIVTTPSKDAKNMAVLVWIGTLFLGFIPSLIIYLVKKDDAYITDQSQEALNWSITFSMALLLAWVLCFVLIGFVLLPIVMICNLVFCIMGAVSTSNGNNFRVPFALRLIK